jgi:two-component system NarL family response regulator
MESPSSLRVIESAVGNVERLVPQGHKVRVLIAHSDSIIRAGLSALLGAEHDMQVTTCSDAVACHSDFDVIVLAHRQALEYLRSIAADAKPRILVITQMEREWDVRAALVAGAQGYLLQNTTDEQLLVAVRMLSQGMHYVSPELSHCMAESFTCAGLTGRETDVLQLLAQGRCNKSIARELGIGVGTVKTHIKGVFHKLGATARTHAVVLATQRGLVDVSSTATYS